MLNRYTKCVRCVVSAAVTAFLLALVGCNGSQNPPAMDVDIGPLPSQQEHGAIATPSPTPEFIKGVTYFGKAWPINFWNSDLSGSGEDFKSIKDDGFNAIVLVVPWGEFQPKLDPVTFDDHAFEQLQSLCTQAKSDKLNVFLRVSYLWDFAPDEQMPNIARANALITSDTLQPAWRAYLQRVRDATAQCASGYFLSWEDYWHVIDMAKAAAPGEAAALVSKQTGFSEWAEKNASSSFRDAFAADRKKFGVYPVPSESSPDFSQVYAWFDDQLTHRLLARAAQVLPNATIEARVDSDPVYRDGKVDSWYSHGSTYSVASSPYLMTYWAPAMGAENKGEKESAKDAIDRFVYIQKRILERTSNRLLVEQFLYTDNTPKMSHNALIDPAEMPKFLSEMSGPLLQFTSGYALWGYQNYRASALYNGSFARGLQGWSATGSVTLPSAKGASSIAMSKGAKLGQYIPVARDHYRSAGDGAIVRFHASGAARLQVSFGSGRAMIDVSGNAREYSVELKDANSDSEFSVQVLDGQVALTDIYLYRFVQASSARDDSGHPLPELELIRGMNKSIDDLAGLPSAYTAKDGNIDRVVGIFDVEHDGDHAFAWAGPEVVAYLRAASDSVTVSGQLRVSMFHGVPSCRINGFIDDVDVGSIEMKQDGPFALRLPVYERDVHRPTKVTLRSSCRTNPKEGMGDQRVLGFVLNAVQS